MGKKPIDPDEALAAPFYAFAILLVAVPLLDFLQSIGSPRLGSVQWRFASVGLLSGVLLTPMLGIVMAMTVAAVRAHIGLQRFLAIVNLALAIVLLLLLAGFVLDVVQLANVVPDRGRPEFQAASVKAIVKHSGAVLVLCFLGLRGFRLSSQRRARSDGRPPVPLVSA